MTGVQPTRSYALAVTEGEAPPHLDAQRVTEPQIHAVVLEFYQRAQRDDLLGPVFNDHIRDWGPHLQTMTDFWSAALLRTGRYSGRPIEVHRLIDNLTPRHFDRWLAFFEATVNSLCSPEVATAFLDRARRMHTAMTRALELDTITSP